MRNRRVTVSELRAFNAALKKRLRKEQTRLARIAAWRKKNEALLGHLEGLKRQTKQAPVRHVEDFGFSEPEPSYSID